MSSYLNTLHNPDRFVKQGDCQVTGRPLFVRLFPELSVAALKFNLDKELALWYELRAINVTGCG
ncbi:unnamed protein product, partial [marine sediment metagenome]